MKCELAGIVKNYELAHKTIPFLGVLSRVTIEFLQDMTPEQHDAYKTFFENLTDESRLKITIETIE